MIKNLFKLEGMENGIFISRPNRYLSKVEIKDGIVDVHVHDPGRLLELLYAENECLIKYAAKDHRKTDWDMIAAKKGDEFILVHSGYHRYIAEAILNDSEISPFGKLVNIKAEVTHLNSRLDFKAESDLSEIWIEVKGCSLSEHGVARFPDAPTIRGTKHLESLMAIKKGGARAAVLMLVLSEADIFEPNGLTDPKFYSTFYEALATGVEIYPVNVILDIETGYFKYKGILPIKDVNHE